jgi:branched-chain amino acid transport system substrate-binding protein
MKLKTLFFVAATVLFVASCKSSPSVQVGAILPLTGFGSYTGELVKKGYDMAIDSLNKENKLTFVVGDNQSTGAMGINVYKDFKMRGISIFISCGAPQTMSFAALSKDQEEVLFVTAANVQALTEVSNRTIRMSPTGKSMSAKLADFNIDSLGCKRTAIAYINNDMGDEFFRGYKDRIDERGAEIAAVVTFENTQRDFKEVINKIAMSKPDVIYVTGVGESLGILVRQMMQNPSLKGIPITGDFNFSQPSVLNLIENRNTDIYYTDIAVADDFAQKYESRYNEPVSSYAAFGFSMVQIYYDLIINEKITNPVELYNRITGHSFDTAINTVAFDEHGEPEFSIEFIKMLKNE